MANLTRWIWIWLFFSILANALVRKNSKKNNKIKESSSVSEIVANSLEPYPWKERWKYYFPSLEKKMSETLVGTCETSWKRLGDGTIELPVDSSSISVASIPISKSIVMWWKQIPRPKQMRVEPNLCDIIYTRRIPIFNNSGCQLPVYMNPSAPRCQTKYLKWICDEARMPINISLANHFVLPEADHSQTELPPQPWIITARDSFVSMCGHVSTQCGLIRTTANCMATGYKTQAALFHKKCPTSLVEKVCCFLCN